MSVTDIIISECSWMKSNTMIIVLRVFFLTIPLSQNTQCYPNISVVENMFVTLRAIRIFEWIFAQLKLKYHLIAFEGYCGLEKKEGEGVMLQKPTLKRTKFYESGPYHEIFQYN